MFFEASQVQPFWQILLAAFLGALIGLERQYKKKEAGIRTFSLISLGSCFFTVIAVYFSSSGTALSSLSRVDPTRVIQAVALGIGFVGSGLIIYHKLQIEGLTTAAALWATAAMGIAVGLGLLFLAVLGTLLIVLILAGLGSVEQRIFPAGPGKTRKKKSESVKRRKAYAEKKK